MTITKINRPTKQATIENATRIANHLIKLHFSFLIRLKIEKIKANIGEPTNTTFEIKLGS